MEQLIIALHILICLGIMGEYIGRMFMQAKGRPLAIVREVVVRPTVGAVRFGLSMMAKNKSVANLDVGIPAAEVIEAHNATAGQPAAGDAPVVSAPAATDAPAVPEQK